MRESYDTDMITFGAPVCDQGVVVARVDYNRNIVVRSVRSKFIKESHRSVVS